MAYVPFFLDGLLVADIKQMVLNRAEHFKPVGDSSYIVVEGADLDNEKTWEGYKEKETLTSEPTPDDFCPFLDLEFGTRGKVMSPFPTVRAKTWTSMDKTLDGFMFRETEFPEEQGSSGDCGECEFRRTKKTFTFGYLLWAKLGVAGVEGSAECDGLCNHVDRAWTKIKVFLDTVMKNWNPTFRSGCDSKYGENAAALFDANLGGGPKTKFCEMGQKYPTDADCNSRDTIGEFPTIIATHAVIQSY